MTNFLDIRNSTITGAKILASGSVQVTLVTQEMDTEIIVQLIESLKNDKQVNVLAGAPLEGGKSPSARLRNALFIDHRDNHREGDFESYYAQEMEKYISKVKARIPDNRYNDSYSD